MVILFASGKGGSGKTTAAILTALALRAGGVRAGVRDLDPQRTASRWLEDDPELLDWRAATVRLVDTAPRLDAPELARAARDSDRIAIVSRPSPADLFAGQDTAELLKRLGELNKARLLFTNVRPGTVLSRDLDSIADQLGVERLWMQFQMRESYQHAVLAGWAGLSAEARREATDVAQALTGKRW